jgi:hypothetical protein
MKFATIDPEKPARVTASQAAAPEPTEETVPFHRATSMIPAVMAREN